VPGDVGASCGDDTFRLWPYGARIVDALDSLPAGSPIAADHVGDSVETYLSAGKKYTALQGGSSFTDRIYVSKEGACGTGIGNPASSGITNFGARLVFTPTTAGVYSFWPSGPKASSGAAYSFNVVQGDVGDSCFTGTAPAGGTGDAYVLWPLGGTIAQDLGIGDRIGDMQVNRFHDDFETHLEGGEKIKVTVTRINGSVWTPKVYLTRAGTCTTAVASSPETSGTVGTLTYTVPASGAGIYTIVVTSSAQSGTGTYFLASVYQ
jgi:hypothetical protein